MCTNDRYLDFAGAAAKLTEIGIAGMDGKPIAVNTVRTWADRGRLPFFKGPDGKRRISEHVLVEAFRKMQDEALKPPRKAR